MQNSQRASEAALMPSMQNLPAEPAVATFSVAPSQTDEDVWDVWPYCWAIAGWDLACERFHSLHEKLIEWKLARYNRRARARFQTLYWRNWDRDAADETLELRLM